jgi:hypothetical protein
LTRLRLSAAFSSGGAEPPWHGSRPSGMSSAAGGYRLAWLAVTCLALTACGDQPGGTAADPTAEPGDRYTTTAYVLEAQDHGPQLCWILMHTNPPQCHEGIEVVGWDWTGLDGSEAFEGTTWGQYVVIGTYDGTRFTVTEPPTPAPPPAPEPGLIPSTPCAAPPQGWGVIDAATTGEEALSAAIAYAEAQPDYAAVWLDSSILNIRFTGNLESHERALRAIWGGALCVSMGERTAAELETIRAALYDELSPIVRSSAASLVRGRVHLEVVVDDGLQQRLDDRYGPGLVEVFPLLVPTD